MKITIVGSSVSFDPQFKGVPPTTFESHFTEKDEVVQEIINFTPEFGFDVIKNLRGEITVSTVLNSSRVCYYVVGSETIGYRYYCGADVIDINTKSYFDASKTAVSMFILSHLED